VGKNVERELEKITEQAEEAVDQGTPRKTADVSKFERPSEARERPEVVKEELEEKSIKELEPILADKIAKTVIANIEKDPMINAVIDQIVDQLANTKYDQKEENIATEISNIAYRVSGGDVGTYAWLQEELETRVHESIKKRPIM